MTTKISFAAIVIAHTVVNNTKFPMYTSFGGVADELYATGHMPLLRAANDPAVTLLYNSDDLSLAIAKLFELDPSIKGRYEDYHSNRPYVTPVMNIRDIGRTMNLDETT